LWKFCSIEHGERCGGKATEIVPGGWGYLKPTGVGETPASGRSGRSMEWLSRLTEWATRDPVGQVDDEWLGPLTLSDSCWEARLIVGGAHVCVQIGGRYTPDAELIAHARDILREFSRFQVGVATFLEAEANREAWVAFGEEIRSLKIRDICLFWPDRPDDGMIFFDGPDECRCWRCDYSARTPTCLNFDR
jgi:hypothetical protein